jgi:molecular chaperone GrpE (heat shock protein)
MEAMDTELTLSDEFASTMQQLVAEAEKTVPFKKNGVIFEDSDSAVEMRAGFALLSARMASLERAIADGFDRRNAAEAPQSAEMQTQLKKIDEHMTAIRSTESVNHRLFNSLHQELKGYRDNFMRDSLQKPVIRDLVVLFDDLSALSGQMQTGGASGQWCANIENGLHSLTEILNRMDVTEIEPKERVDRAIHRVLTWEPADFEEEDGLITMRLKRGFMWRGQLLRAEEVVAKRYEPDANAAH